jgi:hypothetical protein
MTEASILPVNKRPRMAIRCTVRTEAGWHDGLCHSAGSALCRSEPLDPGAISANGHRARARDPRHAPQPGPHGGVWRRATGQRQRGARYSRAGLPGPGSSGIAIEIAAEVFVVQGTPQRDRERLVWTVELCRGGRIRMPTYRIAEGNSHDPHGDLGDIAMMAAEITAGERAVSKAVSERVPASRQPGAARSPAQGWARGLPAPSAPRSSPRASPA